MRKSPAISARAPDLVEGETFRLQVLSPVLGKKRMTQKNRTHFSPKEITEKVGVGMDTVLCWIRNGDLKASNVSNTSSRVRWRIAAYDLADFMEQRANQAKEACTQIPNREFL